jgi:hypothetical protein
MIAHQPASPERVEPADRAFAESPGRTSPDWVALAATAVTIAIHLTLTAINEGPYPVFITGACLFWAGFIIVRACRDRRIFRDWGFRADNLLQAAWLPAVLFVVAAGCMAGYAGLQGTFSFPLHTLPLLLLYPVWGVIQQFLALSIVINNLERIRGLGQHKPLLVLLGAALFGLIHVYDIRLVVGTFFLELVTIPLFLRYRNIWPLGVLHGWLGGLFYLWVLNRDLWADTFG